MNPFFQDLKALLSLPKVTLHLQAAQAEDNDPFFRKLILNFYAKTRRRNPRHLFLRDFRWGVALQPMELQPGMESTLESSAVRNQKKALRNGYQVEKMEYNKWLEDIQKVRRSTEVRQGPVDPRLLSQPVRPITDPPSRNNIHDYPFFGVFREGVLVAYASCWVAGEVAMIEHILGHADHQDQGIMPLLILGIKEQVRNRHPHVRWLGYEMWFGASDKLRRFKKKMGFRPYKVNWALD
jgi:hypothetical protein